MAVTRKATTGGTLGRINYKPKVITPTDVYNSMFLDAPAPAYAGNDNTFYNIGTLFKPLVNGDITAFKFWKGFNNTDTTHLCILWDSTTLQPIYQTSMTSQAGYVGWVTKNLDTPISVIANKQYAIAQQSYFYVATSYALAGETYTRDKLNAIKGVFASVPNYPNRSFQNSNYYTDVVFRYKA